MLADSDEAANGSDMGFEWGTTIGVALHAFHLWRSSRKDLRRGRLTSVLPVQPTREALKQIRFLVGYSVDRCFGIVDYGLSRVEALVDDVDRWLDVWLPRQNVTPLSDLLRSPSSEAIPQTPVKAENADSKQRRRARVRCIVATPPIPVESAAAIDPVPPLRRKNRPRTTTQISTILDALTTDASRDDTKRPARPEDAQTDDVKSDTRPEDAQTDDARTDARAAAAEATEPLSAFVAKPSMSRDDATPEFVSPNDGNRATAAPEKPENASASAHGRRQRLSTSVDGIGLVSAGHENRSTRADYKWTAALFWGLLVHHFFAGVVARCNRAQEFLGKLQREIISSVRCAAIWIGKECVGVIGAMRAVAFNAFTRIHERLRATTLLLKHRRRQTRSRRRRKLKERTRKNGARLKSRRAKTDATSSRRKCAR